MKVTKYPHRFTISMNENEWFALRALVSHGKANFDDPAQLACLDSEILRFLKSDRWQAIDGPLTVDEVKSGRGGFA